jgi:hypothetical protein
MATALTAGGVAAIGLNGTQALAEGSTSPTEGKSMAKPSLDSLYSTSVHSTTLTGEAADRVAIRSSMRGAILPTGASLSGRRDYLSLTAVSLSIGATRQPPHPSDRSAVTMNLSPPLRSSINMPRRLISMDRARLSWMAIMLLVRHTAWRINCLRRMDSASYRYCRSATTTTLCAKAIGGCLLTVSLSLIGATPVHRRHKRRPFITSVRPLVVA